MLCKACLFWCSCRPKMPACTKASQASFLSKTAVDTALVHVAGKVGAEGEKLHHSRVCCGSVCWPIGTPGACTPCTSPALQQSSAGDALRK